MATQAQTDPYLAGVNDDEEEDEEEEEQVVDEEVGLRACGATCRLEEQEDCVVRWGQVEPASRQGGEPHRASLSCR